MLCYGIWLTHSAIPKFFSNVTDENKEFVSATDKRIYVLRSELINSII